MLDIKRREFIALVGASQQQTRMVLAITSSVRARSFGWNVL
jgi:hypothetical protein